VTRVLHDVAVELADRVAAALQHLDEDIVAHAEHARDARLLVVAAGLLEDRVHDGRGEGSGGAAGVETTYEHLVLSSSS
jgi:hypothetical protein